MQANFVCSDGRYPEASSGCCITSDESSGSLSRGCPKLCESERIWRLDRRRGVPWWARRHAGNDIVLQCTCNNCPADATTAHYVLAHTLEEGLWDNGQTMLTDIARREGLKHGPNRRMQQLMAERNAKILEASKSAEADPHKAQHLDTWIGEINAEYTAKITKAAHEYPDSPSTVTREFDDDDDHTVIITIICSVLAVVLVASCACIIVSMRRTKGKDQQEQMRMAGNGTYEGNHVVVGQPVVESADGAISGGTPVYVSAPTSPSKK